MNHTEIVAEIVECAVLIHKHQRFDIMDKVLVMALEHEAKNAPVSERARICEIMVKMQGMLYGMDEKK